MGGFLKGGEELGRPGGVCLEEEVARLLRSGMSAREMGVDEGWVESLISMSADEDSSAEHRG